MDGFERRKEKKKEDIRRASLELFESYGFKKVSIADIARRAGVSQVTIYNHFGSREALVRDVMKWHMTALFHKYKATMDSDGPFMEKLENIVLDKTNVISKFRGEVVQAVLHDDPELYKYLLDMYTNRLMPDIISFFKEGSRQGYINPRLSVDSILFFFEILRGGFLAIPDISEYTNKNPEILKEIIHLVTYGLRGEK